MDRPLEDLSPQARVILQTLAASDDPLHTRNLTERTGYANNLLKYHIDKLIDAEYAERIGEVDVGNNFPANLYRLTESGRAAAAKANEFDAHTDDLAERMQDLEETVTTLQQSLLTLYERVDAIEDG